MACVDPTCRDCYPTQDQNGGVARVCTDPNYCTCNPAARKGALNEALMEVAAGQLERAGRQILLQQMTLESHEMQLALERATINRLLSARDALEADLLEADRKVEQLEEELTDLRAALIANAKPTEED